jgi:hypothetical protein
MRVGLGAELGDGVGDGLLDVVAEAHEVGELVDLAVADAPALGADRAADEVAVGPGLDARTLRF